MSGGDLSDLTLCDHEPITKLEKIQSFAFLLALSNDWSVVRVSENIESYFKRAATDLLGFPLQSFVTPAGLHEIRNRLAVLPSTGSERLFDVKLVPGMPNVDLALHFHEDLLIIEGEKSQKAERMEAASMVRAMAARLGKASSLGQFHKDAARQVLALTGFDRVMIYQFDGDGNGEVIAESTRAGMESFLGLHYPAGDIPSQARALYLRNPFRIIADVDADTIALLPKASAVIPPLDLSSSVSRAVSPVHIEYLKNMGVAASLSISIIVEERLWGLIACHAKTARLPSFVMRTASELLGSMYSMLLESRLRHGASEDEQRARSLADHMITMIAGDETLMSSPGWIQDMTQDMIDCDGVAIYRAGTVDLHGLTPPQEHVVAIAQHMNAASPSRVFVTDHLASVLPACEAVAKIAAGMMSIPVSRTPRDYILLFRRERLQEIRWGGDPAKIVEHAADGPRISPRKSFAAFEQLVRGKASPFSDREIRIGEAIRQALIEVILRYSDGATEERRRAAERQELLIAELNHRVRNILALISSLVRKTGQTADTVSSYVESLNGRVRALARAHDRITQQNWGPAPLAGLFEDEVAAHDGSRGRLTVLGPDVLLQPQAISTMALVVHELVTNSCKHGALSGTGRVDVVVEAANGEGVHVRWKEHGGPAVAAPTRRGFGSVILERTVPFDLQGTATLRFLLEGLEAEFFIPKHHLHPLEASPPAVQAEMTGAATLSGTVQEQRKPLERAHVLLVEDNMLIALEAEDMLRELGADQVAIASTVKEAEQLFRQRTFQFAMLDINVGTSTTFALAKKLYSAGLPFVFASGYGDEVGFDRGAYAVVVQKPYQADHLRRAIHQARQSAEQSRVLDASAGKPSDANG